MSPLSLVLWLGLVSVLFGCRPPAERPKDPRTLVVFAAASLREPFSRIARDFEAAHPEVQVRTQFAGTQQLRMQLEHGARVDVFASADWAHLRALEAAGKVGQGQVFARNQPVMIVSEEAASKLPDFTSLPNAERIVLGGPAVPIGRYSAEVLARVGPEFRDRVEGRVVSRELNVRQVLQKVAMGEAEAGIVYRSDLSSDTQAVIQREIPDRWNVVAEYPLAVVKEALEPALAQAWVEWVQSERGQQVLEAAGFLRAPGTVARP